MKIYSEGYKPVVIKLEKESEAETFIRIIDKLDEWHVCDEPPRVITKQEYEMIRTISDLFTDLIGSRGYKEAE